MDLDRYIQKHDATWRRLDHLTRRGRRLDGSELAELVRLYPRVSADLSHARTRYADPEVNARLSEIVGNANNLIYSAPRKSDSRILRFFSESFPAAVWSSRRFIAIAALCLLVPAIGMGLWLEASGSTLDAAVPPELQKLIAQSEFRSYYSSHAASDFSIMLMLNNIRVALLAFALGVVPIVGSAWILVTNGAHLGVMAAVMHRAGEGTQFWVLILPHGLLEISSVVIAGAAGLRLSWALIAPGDRTRLQAFASEGVRSVVVVGGLACCFVVAALIEAFITPSGLPDIIRIAIGVGVFAAFVAYVVTFGSAAERRGVTGMPTTALEPSGALDHEISVAEL